MADAFNPIYSMTKEEILYELLLKEQGYYSSILEVTRQENEKLGSQKPLSEINPLLKKKKIFLSCIAEIETALTPLKKYWQNKKDRTDPESQKIKNALANLDRLLKEILELDLISQQILERYLDTFKQPLPSNMPQKKRAPETPWNKKSNPL